MATDLTKNQTLVLGVLSHAEGPMSAYTILDELRSEGLRAPLQVYRALEKLMEMGRVHRVDSMNAFVACVHDHPHAAGLIAFTICEECGDVEEIASRDLEAVIENWTGPRAFRARHTAMEIRGLCARCVS